MKINTLIIVSVDLIVKTTNERTMWMKATSHNNTHSSVCEWFCFDVSHDRSASPSISIRFAEETKLVSTKLSQFPIIDKSSKVVITSCNCYFIFLSFITIELFPSESIYSC